MRNRNFSSRDQVAFSCANPIPYGTQITILEEGREQNGEWFASVLVASSRIEQIYLKTKEAHAKNFLILRCEHTGEHGFSHRAVSTERLEQSSQMIEDEIVALLSSI